MLIEKSLTTFSDGKQKIKHLFLDLTGKAYTGWSDIGEELSDELVADLETYDDARAQSYVVRRSEYEGKLRYNVDLTPQGAS